MATGATLGRHMATSGSVVTLTRITDLAAPAGWSVSVRNHGRGPTCAPYIPLIPPPRQSHLPALPSFCLGDTQLAEAAPPPRRRGPDRRSRRRLAVLAAQFSQRQRRKQRKNGAGRSLAGGFRDRDFPVTFCAKICGRLSG